MIRLIKIAALIGALAFVATAALDHDPEFDLKVAGNAFRAGDMDSTMRMARLAAFLSKKDSLDWGRAQVLEARGADRLGRSNRAMEILDRLLAARPDHLAGLQLRGELRLRAGDAAGALKDLDRSRQSPSESGGADSTRRHKPQAPHVALRAQAYLKVGRAEEAWEDARTAHGLDPKHPEVLYTMSLVLESRGEIKEALKYMENAAHQANRRDSLFVLSDKGKEWINRLITLRAKAKVPLVQPIRPRDD